MKKILKTSLALLALPLAVSAQITFDFESESSTGGGALTSLILTESGVTATISRGGEGFDIAGYSFPVSEYGNRALSPFDDASTSTFFTVIFDQYVSSVSLDMGDYNPSDQDYLILNAYSSDIQNASTLLGQDTGMLPNGASSPSFSYDTLTVGGVGMIKSIGFIGGSSYYPNSVFYDNLTIELAPTNAVPEPSTYGLMGAGLLVLLVAMRRRAAAKS